MTKEKALPTLDEIETVLAEALGTVRRDELCLGPRCLSGLFLNRLDSGKRVQGALKSLGCDPEAVAGEIRQLLNVPGFVISEQGFGPHCVSFGVLALGAYAVLETASGEKRAVS